MRCFKEFLGSVSNSNKKDDYARATLRYATSRRINKRNAIVCNNRGLAFKSKGEYDRPVSDYTRAHQIKTNNAVTVINIGVADLRDQRISMTFYRSYKSKTYLSISRS
jgi:Flp pilus assembly protein TadD